jgi:aryl-alcohol dehydrogenase-like predicted oxidoreductase
MPRFEAAAYAANLALLPAYGALAVEAGCTPAQLALAWLLARGDHVIPIPGTASRAHLREDLDAADVTLDASVLARVDALINQRTVQGGRYSVQSQSEVDTEQFEPA